MIKSFILCIISIFVINCAAAGEVAINAAAGAIGNMIDRRIENHLEKEKDNECEDCEADER
jgi:hypothetical protein